MPEIQRRSLSMEEILARAPVSDWKPTPDEQMRADEAVAAYGRASKEAEGFKLPTIVYSSDTSQNDYRTGISLQASPLKIFTRILSRLQR